jgi:predicted MPP superfamily phosphohydrolase
MTSVRDHFPHSTSFSIRSLLPFEFGAFGPLHIRRERIELGLSRTLRILYASDLHLGHWWTKRVPHQLRETARQAQPEVILLGGDLVDDRRALDGLQQLICALTATAPVYAIPGNHDECVGRDYLQATIETAGGRWLPRNPIEGAVRIDGELDPAPSNHPRLLCAHYPRVFPRAAAAGYRLVLAGHLHGGQCVLAMCKGRLYPAVWFDRWHGLRFSEGAATMLVSRGVADTLPMRFNCPREVLLVEIQ